MPAGRSTRQNARMVARMAAKRTRISASAQPGWLRPKKRGVHRALSAHWMRYRRSAVFCQAQPPCSHARHAATAIMAYRTVQTGPNNQPGGFHVGLASPEYQPPVETKTAVADAL